MKILKLDICFQLPDNYNSSDLNDALEELIKYRKDLLSKPHVIDPADSPINIDPNLSVYDNWWNIVNKTQFKLHGHISICKLENDAWKPIK